MTEDGGAKVEARDSTCTFCGVAIRPLLDRKNNEIWKHIDGESIMGGVLYYKACRNLAATPAACAPAPTPAPPTKQELVDWCKANGALPINELDWDDVLDFAHWHASRQLVRTPAPSESADARLLSMGEWVLSWLKKNDCGCEVPERWAVDPDKLDYADSLTGNQELRYEIRLTLAQYRALASRSVPPSQKEGVPGTADEYEFMDADRRFWKGSAMIEFAKFVAGRAALREGR